GCLCGAAAGGSGEALSVVALVAVYKMFESWSDLLQNQLRRHDRTDVLAVAFAARGTTNLGAFLVVYAAAQDLFAAVAAMSLAGLACLIVIDAPLTWRFARPSFLTSEKGWRPVLDMAAKTLPLGAISLLIALYFALPNYFLELFRSTDELGVFVAVASLPLAAEMLVRATSQATLPRLGGLFAQGNAAGFFALHRRVMTLYFAIGLLGLAATAACGGWVLRLAFGAGFERHTGLLNLMMVAMAVSFLGLAGPLFVAAHSYSRFLWTWVFALAVLAALSAALVPTYGAYGAAWAVLVANAARAGAVHLAVERWVRPLFIAESPQAVRAAAA
ncbi:MAG: oligosaccharide flippase family protein, partial [Planctomycetales bacterium]|nr:oligosaccharide flippase family protein [Planctomycetales bacterium]